MVELDRPEGLPGGEVIAEIPRARKVLSRLSPIRWISGVVATVPLILLLLILIVLVLEALPAIKYNGFGFLTRIPWNPGGQYSAAVKTGGVLHPAGVSFGAQPLIVGTILVSLIAMVIAVPTSIGTAVVVVHRLPRRLSRGVGFLIEILAGIPSVIYGLWGSLTLGPYLSYHIFPTLVKFFPTTGFFKFFTGNVGHGEGLLTTGIVLAIMIIPIIAATTRDLLRQVPTLTEEGALALGLTQREMVRKVSLKWVSSGIIGAGILGLARALGETMAVAMVSGAVLGSDPSNLYSPFTTIAATIVSQLDSAFTDGTQFAVKTLAEAALVLMVITLLANIVARLLVKRVSTTALPVGRGI